VLKIFAFEEKMKLGRKSYKDADFTEARNYFEEAQLIYSKDFRVNFWLARVLVMQGQYDPALVRLNECCFLRPDLGEELINKWIFIAMEKEISDLMIQRW
jgi:tetratricopeptide (TPR) repeat protein